MREERERAVGISSHIAQLQRRARRRESARLLHAYGAMNTEDIRNKLQEGSEQLEEHGRAVMERTKNAVAGLGEYVHEKPWVPIGVVAAVALLIGFLVGQRR